MYEVQVSARSIDPFVDFLEGGRISALKQQAESIRQALGSRAIWNINSTEKGGGVAEMLRSILRYARGLGIDARWLVVQGPPEFFRITKRVHNALHGNAGDGSPLGPEQAAVIDAVMRENIITMDSLIRAGDVVICHDPQTAALVPYLLRKGAHTVWRCHIGHERHDGEVERGWEFLRPYLMRVPFGVFSRRAYAPAWLDAQRTLVLAPCIDPFTVKNRVLDAPTVQAILSQVGLVEGPSGEGSPLFMRDDGSISRVDREAEVLSVGHPPRLDTPLVVQVSRWDGMKDPMGVMQGFARFVRPQLPDGPELMLAGPSLRSVADDPESVEVFGALEQAWRALPHALRKSVHLALLSMEDGEENAAVVNALQRHAAVIVQKSLHEGFGLTVTEALWKRRPVVASAVGGIVDQIRDGSDGILVHDPSDLVEFAQALLRPLTDPELAQRLGENGYTRVRDHYLSLASLEQWAHHVQQLLLAAATAEPVAQPRRSAPSAGSMR